MTDYFSKGEGGRTANSVEINCRWSTVRMTEDRPRNRDWGNTLDSAGKTYGPR